MRVRQLSPEQVAASLDFSIEALAREHPELSARRLVSDRVKYQLIAATIVVAVFLVFRPVRTATALIFLCTVAYIAVTVNRLLLFQRSMVSGAQSPVTDDEALAYPSDDLPIYTVLIPAYREPEVIGLLLGHLEDVVYPRDKLDVKLLLEEDDTETIAAAWAQNPGDHVELVLVPPSEPRTKPKAMNYALAIVEGSILTIYDAEDQPDPLQLRKAAILLERSDPDVVCVQGKLSFANAEQNLLTKWFTLEYAMWFELFLPGLALLKAPIPLGGTSNHFKVDVLRELGAWDPSNVTEDADLGLRLAREGYRCEVLDSVTLEEANSDFINWVKQRSRWYKGYLQTALVHLRRPRSSARALGVKGMAEVILFIMGTPVLALVNTIFWAMTLLWFTFQPHVIKEMFPAVLFYPAVMSWIFGNLVIFYTHILTCRMLKRFELLGAALLVPAYWVMMALAATKAFWQLVFAPSFWEKTTHGLGQHVHIGGKGDAVSNPAPGTVH